MEIKLNNILNIQVENEEVNILVTLMSAILKGIDEKEKKVGFKTTNKIDVEMDEETTNFVFEFCERCGISIVMEENEPVEEENKK